jgi:phosphotransferase system enzyme I (PtsP)
VRVPLYVNTGLLSELDSAIDCGAEGIGLHRTEFPFLIRESFPGEDEQYQIYREILKAFAPRPVTLRTLDVGGDKALPYFSIQEDNPYLGWRGIRVTLDHPEIFLTQARAMLRANTGLGNLQVLFPMIARISELDEALRLLERAYQGLIQEGQPAAQARVGAMIEVPSAVYLAGAMAARLDFLSVGTNDLTQYLLAVDRNNARVAGLYDSLHPAVIDAVYQVVQRARERRKPVSVCGEMAGDPGAALLLLGMGIDSLSMSAASLPRVKWAIRSTTQQEARRLLNRVLKLEDEGAVRVLLNEALERAGLGVLVMSGQ